MSAGEYLDMQADAVVADIYSSLSEPIAQARHAADERSKSARAEHRRFREDLIRQAAKAKEKQEADELGRLYTRVELEKLRQYLIDLEATMQAVVEHEESQCDLNHDISDAVVELSEEGPGGTPHKVSPVPVMHQSVTSCYRVISRAEQTEALWRDVFKIRSGSIPEILPSDEKCPRLGVAECREFWQHARDISNLFSDEALANYTYLHSPSAAVQCEQEIVSSWALQRRPHSSLPQSKLWTLPTRSLR
jgi:hypothetical protein